MRKKVCISYSLLLVPHFIASFPCEKMTIFAFSLLCYLCSDDLYSSVASKTAQFQKSKQARFFRLLFFIQSLIYFPFVFASMVHILI